ncbi:MAG: 16S rRNA (cytosine(1402)-N(4))-methyltransferase RsmH [Porticoccaceae bacterium]
MSEHTTVLLDEAVAALVVNPDGCYVDGTFGRGGHSAAILGKLSENGRLLAIDKDPSAIAAGRERFAGESRIELIHSSFAEIADQLKARDLWGKVDGLLVDLGVSSPQLDEAERGFSFLRDGPLDMRMDTSSGLSAAEWLADVDEGEFADVLFELGEERFARRMAKALVLARAKQSITRTVQLAELLAAAHPAWERGKHPATKAFQAIRIFINRELADLDQLLADSIDCLAIQGRLVAISFHSLEDRRVKRFIRDQQRGRQLPRNLPIPDAERGSRLRKVGGAIKPSASEIERNVRARSAVMRIAERTA